MRRFVWIAVQLYRELPLLMWGNTAVLALFFFAFFHAMSTGDTYWLRVSTAVNGAAVIVNLAISITFLLRIR